MNRDLTLSESIVCFLFFVGCLCYAAPAMSRYIEASARLKTHLEPAKVCTPSNDRSNINFKTYLVGSSPAFK